ncbi:hypothetical protein K7432_015724 [Basidiobolus ranarum]|uniref:Phospho-2-dehydro-3-deoxyheptonate aldolase n=1 Tax=Basidiobolus ranarum TaxID=34480 RepID=A0ABR2VMP7_9FUNG
MNTSDLENILNEVEFDLKNQTLTSNDEWSPSSWRAKKVTQDVVYEDKEELAKVLAKLQHLPPMISPREIKNLREQLSDVALGKSFYYKVATALNCLSIVPKSQLKTRSRLYFK